MQIKIDFNAVKIQALIIMLLLTATSCSEEDEPIIPENSIFEPQTELISLNGNKDNLVLKWKPVVIDDFIGYKVYRLDYFTNELNSPNIITNLGDIVYETDDYLNFEFTDSQIPFNSFINYAVVTEYADSTGDNKTATSINYLSFENTELSFKIISIEKLENGSLQLIWEEDFNEGFENYTIYTYEDNGQVSNDVRYTTKDILLSGEVLDSYNSQIKIDIIDTIQYTANKVNYAVSKKINGIDILSKNFLSIENPRSLKFKPAQTLKNPYKEEEVIIINREGEIVFYNKSSLGRTSLNINSKIFSCSIGEYNGITDLYVPSEGGQVFIIDLNSYVIKDVINLNTDFNIVSAIPIDNYLVFIEKHFLNHVTLGGIFTYDRINKTVLNRLGTSMKLNTKLVHAKDNYFLYDTDNFQHWDASAIRKLSVNGNVVTYDYSFNGSRRDGNVFAISPDKNFYISSEYGFYCEIDYQNISETIINSFSPSPIFGDVKISTNNYIYFTIPQDAIISVFEKNNFSSAIKQYNTIGKPILIEIFENQIISLNQLENYYFIQTIIK